VSSSGRASERARSGGGRPSGGGGAQLGDTIGTLRCFALHWPLDAAAARGPVDLARASVGDGPPRAR
jgi:hypothetical protein